LREGGIRCGSNVDCRLVASHRKNNQESARLRVMRLLNSNPKMSTRQVAHKVGISNGAAYYVLKALIEKGYVKIGNFSNNPGKKRYAYLLTPKGIREKSILTQNFIVRKRTEFEELRIEIKAMEKEAGFISSKDTN
jgi:EPS-associated MarR family transcriptional regulator